MTLRPTVRASALVLGILAVPYAVATAATAHRRLLWNDELYTYHFAKLPSLADVWHQLATGVEQTPPFFYVVTRASIAAFGDGPLALRLPELIGLFAACACLFLVVARRTSWLGGAIAALVVLATNAYPYAYEARPYALVLAFAAAGLLCWQLRADTGSAAAAVGMALALALAVSTHYYAALLVLPLAAAEAARSLERRRLDRGVLVGLVAGLAPLAAYWPLIEGARRYSSTFWTTYGWSSSWKFYGWLLHTDVVPPRIGTNALVGAAAAIVGAALVVSALRTLPVAAPAGWAGTELRRSGSRTTSSPPDRQGDGAERAAAVAFLLLPLVAVAAAQLSTGAYTERYVLSAVLGLALLVPLALHRLDGRRPVLQVVVLLALAAAAARAAAYEYENVGAAARAQRDTISFLGHAPRSPAPIAVAGQHDFLELSHEAPPALARRLRYLADRRLALHYLGTDSSEEGLVVMGTFAQLHVVPFRHVMRADTPFLVYDGGGSGGNDWLLRALRDRGRRPHVLRRDGRRLLLYVPAARR